MVINWTLIILIVALATMIALFNVTYRKTKTNELYKKFSILTIFFIIYLVGMCMQVLFKDSGISPIYFEYFAYIGGMCFPNAIFIMAITYLNGGKKKKSLNLLYIISVVLLLILWTNDYHHLFYRKYSTYLMNSQFGIALDFFSTYSYCILGLSAIILILASIRKSGFVSKQTILILVGFIIPTLANFIGVFDESLKLTVYVTPVLLSATAVCFYVAIFRFKALNVVPVATKTIIDNMTDSFIVLSEDGTIVDINKTCIDKFKPLIELKANMNLYQSMKKDYSKQLKVIKNDIKEAMSEKKNIDKAYHITIEEVDMYVDVDIQPIKAKYSNEYVAILLLIHDVTKEKKDMEIMTKNESLVILGELAGGVAHDVNTPISAIKSGVTMLKSMAKNDDEKMLLTSMDSCADKIIALVNSLRNQIRNIGSDTVADISITTVINDIKIILNNELKKSNVTLEVDIKEDIHLSGNSTKLSQVVTNIVTNAIQAYNGQGGRVEVSAYKEENMAKISVQDHASGIPENIRPYIFKNILTTKGVSGTGFGLYLAYSVIKGAFGGDITFDTKTGEGTTFYISIPLN